MTDHPPPSCLDFYKLDKVAVTWPLIYIYDVSGHSLVWILTVITYRLLTVIGY